MYLQKLSRLLQGAFTVNIYINQSTFINHAHLVDEINAFAKAMKNEITAVKFFGDFDNTTSPHKNILRSIEQGKGIEAFAFVEKIKILKELSKF